MSIQWGRVLLAAFLMEVILFAIAIPLFLSGAGRLLVYVVPLVALAATFAVTVWLGRRIKTKPVLHGVLIGVVGTLMYVGLTRAQLEPMAILGRSCIEGCWRRRWRNGLGAASDRAAIGAEGRLLKRARFSEIDFC